MGVINIFGILIGSLVLFAKGDPLQWSVGSLFDSGKNIATGIAQDTVNLLPTPTGLFEGGKNLIAGYPFEFVSTAVNQMCASALSSKTVQPRVTPDLSKMQFQIRTACENASVPLQSAELLFQSPLFDINKKVVILVTGWTTQVNSSEGIDVIGKAYHCRGDVNFLAVDAAAYVDTLYTWSAFNTDAIGEAVALGLEKLIQQIPLENIHLIGHSLGAHIVGSAARYFNERTQKKIYRVTGLDPAKPCFNEGESLAGLQRGDSEFVDVIHSNPGVLGKREPTGDIDFYPGGLAPLITGCYDVVCAHGRAWKMYAETVYPGNENNFLSQRCVSLTALRENRCQGKQVAMGYAFDQSQKGNYFLEINADSPYGKNNKGPIDETCGVCKK